MEEDESTEVERVEFGANEEPLLLLSRRPVAHNQKNRLANKAQSLGDYTGHRNSGALMTAYTAPAACSKTLHGQHRKHSLNPPTFTTGAALALCWFLRGNAEALRLSERTVIELGCGLGLAGIFAARRRPSTHLVPHVSSSALSPYAHRPYRRYPQSARCAAPLTVFTDGADDAMELCRRSAELNAGIGETARRRLFPALTSAAHPCLPRRPYIELGGAIRGTIVLRMYFFCFRFSSWAGPTQFHVLPWRAAPPHASAALPPRIRPHCADGIESPPPLRHRGPELTPEVAAALRAAGRPVALIGADLLYYKGASFRRPPQSFACCPPAVNAAFPCFVTARREYHVCAMHGVFARCVASVARSEERPTTAIMSAEID